MYVDEEEPADRFKEFQNFITIQFKKGNIKELVGCKSCKSSGLDKNKLTMANELEKYCESCKGTGITKLDLDSKSGLYTCKICNGYGYVFGQKCSNCDKKGFFDWIDNIIGIDR